MTTITCDFTPTPLTHDGGTDATTGHGGRLRSVVATAGRFLGRVGSALRSDPTPSERALAEIDETRSFHR